jgi:hypothetical protein
MLLKLMLLKVKHLQQKIKKVNNLYYTEKISAPEEIPGRIFLQSKALL